MAGFSGATGVPLKQMQDAIAQSTASLIQHIEVDIGGTSITSQEDGKYYAAVDLSNSISANYYVLCAIWVVNVNIAVRLEATTNRRLILVSDSPYTIPSGRKVRIYYHT